MGDGQKSSRSSGGGVWFPVFYSTSGTGPRLRVGGQGEDAPVPPGAGRGGGLGATAGAGSRGERPGQTVAGPSLKFRDQRPALTRTRARRQGCRGRARRAGGREGGAPGGRRRGCTAG